MFTQLNYISFKFKNDSNYDSISFQSNQISLAYAKKLIAQKLKLGLTEKYELIFYNQQTQVQIKDNNAMLEKNSAVIIERVPINRLQSSCHFKLDEVEISKSYIVVPFSHQNNTPFIRKQNFQSLQTFQNYQNQNSSKEKIQFLQTEQLPNVELIHRRNQNMDSTEISKLFFSPATKYLILKSFNYENIAISKKHSIWSTTGGYKERKLYSMIRNNQNVIVFFSVNKSSKFQGFAKLTGYQQVSGNNYFQTPQGFRLGGCFTLQWLRTTELSFSNIWGRNNPFNDNEPVTKSRDSQEIPYELGEEFCQMFEMPDNFFDDKEKGQLVKHQEKEDKKEDEQKEQLEIDYFNEFSSDSDSEEEQEREEKVEEENKETIKIKEDKIQQEKLSLNKNSVVNQFVNNNSPLYMCNNAPFINQKHQSFQFFNQRNNLKPLNNFMPHHQNMQCAKFKPNDHLSYIKTQNEKLKKVLNQKEVKKSTSNSKKNSSTTSHSKRKQSPSKHHSQIKKSNRHSRNCRCIRCRISHRRSERDQRSRSRSKSGRISRRMRDSNQRNRNSNSRRNRSKSKSGRSHGRKRNSRNQKSHQRSSHSRRRE